MDDEMAQMIAKTIGEIEGEWSQKGRRDIYPSEKAGILEKRHHWIMREMEWGMPLEGIREDGPLKSKKRLLINVRCETVLDKSVFSDGFKRNRCIIPAMGFYEWNRNKEKAQFSRTDGQVMYLAGFYKIIDGKEYFSILTTKANTSVAPVHERMPLILEERELYGWMRGEEYAQNLLKKVPAFLKRSQAYEQQVLPFI